MPVDNPTFKHRGKWAKRTGTGYYLNTFSSTKRRGATLTLAGVQAKALSIIVTKCRRCGVIKVFFKGSLLKRINLRSEAAARQKLRFVSLRAFSSVHTGTVRVRVVSRGKLVIIEGLGVSAVWPAVPFGGTAEVRTRTRPEGRRRRRRQLQPAIPRRSRP